MGSATKISQALVWCVALAIDLAGPYMFGVEGFPVSAGHFAERYGLIIIIALGESIVAVDVGAAGIPLDAGVVAAALAGIVIAGALWWAYFDVVAPVAQRTLREASGAALNRQRLVTAAACLTFIPLATRVDALPAVAAIAGICAALIAYETSHFRESRARVRAAGAYLYSLSPAGGRPPGDGLSH